MHQSTARSVQFTTSRSYSEFSLEEWQPYSQMVRLVMERYTQKTNFRPSAVALSPTHRLFLTRLQEHAGWLKAYSHIPFVYFSNPRFPAAVRPRMTAQHTSCQFLMHMFLTV